MGYLDLTQLPSNIAALLLAPGTELPPLQWSTRANRGIQKTLEAMNDATLFGRDNLADPAMAQAVRTLLYLWGGWPAEAMQNTETAPAKERLYIQAICQRQVGESANSKAVLQRLCGHPIQANLTSWAIQKLQGENAGPLVRFRQLLELCQEWEPYAFVDLYEQARAGQANGGEAAVSAIQCYEFELLLAHCYVAATGCPLGRNSDQKRQAEEARLEQWKRQMQARRATRKERPLCESVTPKPSPASQDVSSQKTRPSPGLTVVLHCPKCAALTQAAESQRGQKTRCTQCGTEFLIPGKSQENKVASRIRIACPKCDARIDAPPTARGQKIACPQCHTQFLVPINASVPSPSKPATR